MNYNKSKFLERISSPWYKNLAIIQNGFMKFSHEFFEKNGYMVMNFPITTSSISSPMGLGSDSLPVEISFFDTPTYLADSMQFMLEYGCRVVNNACYYIMPSFRGEKCDERHLNQFFHSEAELIGDLPLIQEEIEKYLHFLIDRLLANYEENIYNLGGSTKEAVKIQNKSKIDRVEYLEMVKFIKKHDCCNNMLEYREDCTHPVINAKGERYILECFDGAVWLMHFPDELVPFYQASENALAKNADLLLGYGEVVGCGERHSTGTDVLAALKKHRVDPESYNWYIDMKQELPLQTAGFGMGMERFLMWLLSCNDIRKLQMLERENGKIIIP